ncbi:MAG: hypothetical protein EWV67_21320 [Microcystis sp. M_QC_C_20170808_M2Col]|nr:MAG: hypothetical protein EWV67_21320 [Microcystis sp. M_QC_C_20170808_M2Col]TRT69797.1 MAG: hypothetical protein EWV68_08015 [Microcystis sp. M_QC_C_20170808_M9Col]
MDGKINGEKSFNSLQSLTRVCGKKFFVGVGCGPPNPPDIGGAGGVWGFTSFEVANYLIFREKVPKFPPLFDFKKA